ncbi:MAG: DUF4116 domain-containing protein [Gammaproteobacteria bacterium]|nr:DUF4116 domain-containing protein [Gammaproteobacteria bacterium]
MNLESAIEENGLLLQEISNDAIDKKLVLLAVRQNGLALRFAPEEFRNDAEIARIAVQENKHAFLYVLGGARNDIAVQFKRWIRPNINNFLVGFVAATCIGRQASDSKLPLFALGFLGTLGGSVSIMISWDDDDDALDDDASPSMF